MNKNLILLMIVSISLLVACQSATPATPMDSVTVIDKYIAAINAHDVEAALEFVDNNAVYSPEGNPIKGTTWKPSCGMAKSSL